MKLIETQEITVHSGTIVAQFGNARLIRKPNRSHILVGGSLDDRREAREWVSLFLHEAVFRDMN